MPGWESFSTGNLLRRQFQHGLNGGAAGDVDNLVDGSAALLDQFNQGQHELGVLAEQAGEVVGADWLLLRGIQNVISFLHGGSPLW